MQKDGTQTKDVTRRSSIDWVFLMQSLAIQEFSPVQLPLVMLTLFMLRSRLYIARRLCLVEVSFSAQQKRKWAKKFNSHATMETH